ncbi:MAG: hypothetical protein IKZ25_03015 [Clostridia bacterium]|nr:hypothetical protein [Clostridia bacterium]
MGILVAFFLIFGDIIFKAFLILLGVSLVGILWKQILSVVLFIVVIFICILTWGEIDMKLKEKYNMRRDKCFSDFWTAISMMEFFVVIICYMVPKMMETSPFIPVLVNLVIYGVISYLILSAKCRKLDKIKSKVNYKESPKMKDLVKKYSPREAWEFVNKQAVDYNQPRKKVSVKKQVPTKPVHSAPSMARKASPQRQDWWKHKELWEDYPEPDYSATYTYCKVAFEDLDRTFYYRTRNPNLKIGDKVIVPFGKDLNAKEGMIVSIKNYKGSEAPYPLEKTKHIIEKVK